MILPGACTPQVPRREIWLGVPPEHLANVDVALQHGDAVGPAGRPEAAGGREAGDGLGVTLHAAETQVSGSDRSSPKRVRSRDALPHMASATPLLASTKVFSRVGDDLAKMPAGGAWIFPGWL